MTSQEQIEESTRSTAEGWLRALITGDLEAAVEYLAPDVEFINHTPVPGYNTDMVWIGTHRGREAVARSILQFVELIEVLSEEVVALIVEGEDAIAVVHEISRGRRTGVEFEVEFIQRMTIRDGQIVRWRSFTDSASIVRSLRGVAA